MGIYIESESVVIHCTLRRERGGEGESKSKECPTGDKARGIVCEKGPVFRMKAASVLHVKAQQ